MSKNLLSGSHRNPSLDETQEIVFQILVNQYRLVWYVITWQTFEWTLMKLETYYLIEVGKDFFGYVLQNELILPGPV